MPYILPHETPHGESNPQNFSLGDSQRAASSSTHPALPFPSSSQSHDSAQPQTRAEVPARRLKSSLKSSETALDGECDGDDDQGTSITPRGPGTRSLSLPSPKLVHFPSQDHDLESVRFYRVRGKPRSVSNPDEETETETDGNDSSSSASVLSRPWLVPASAREPDLYALDAARSSPVPPLRPNLQSPVHLETLQLPRASPPVLCGTVLVRNLAFAKTVTARFSLDSWTTVSDVSAAYVMSLPHAPPPFHTVSRTKQDGPTVATDPASSSPNSNTWDRFSFRISLPERHLRDRTLLLAIRYQAANGDWWDNNDGGDYAIKFDFAAPNPDHLRRIARPTSPLSYSTEASSPRSAFATHWTPDNRRFLESATPRSTPAHWSIAPPRRTPSHDTSQKDPPPWHSKLVSV